MQTTTDSIKKFDKTDLDSTKNQPIKKTKINNIHETPSLIRYHFMEKASANSK